MPISMPVMMLGGLVLAMLTLTALAFAGPSSGKAVTRRLNALRDRHGASTGAVIEAQMRKIHTQRATKMDNLAQKLLPNRALLKKRLDMTGKDWTPGQYLIGTMITITVVAGALLIKGAPDLSRRRARALRRPVCPAHGGRLPDQETRREFQQTFPRLDRTARPRAAFGPADLGDARHRGAGNSRPRRRGIPFGRRQGEDRTDDGRRAAGNRQPARHA